MHEKEGILLPEIQKLARLVRPLLPRWLLPVQLHQQVEAVGNAAAADFNISLRGAAFTT